VLTSNGHAGQVYELAGDTAYTLAQYASEVSRQTGKAIGYVNLPEADFKKALLGAGLPEPIAELLANADTAASKGALFDDGHQLSKLIGRPTTPLSVSMKAAL
jgi:NAD(P)H dehydrogenase (quinone)